MPRDLTQLRIAIVVASLSLIAVTRGGGLPHNYKDRVRAEARRDLAKYIEMLHSDKPPMDYEFVVLRIAYSEDPRAIEPMMEVMADTSRFAARGSDLYMAAADFLGRTGDVRAIPVLQRNLALTRWTARSTESVGGVSNADEEVHIACAAALWRLGRLQDAIGASTVVLAETFPRAGGVPRNVRNVVNGPTEIYRDNPDNLALVNRFFRVATRSGLALIRACAAARLVGVDKDYALAVAGEVLTGDGPGYFGWTTTAARVEAIKVLASIGGPKAAQYLREAAKHTDERVRSAAEAALRGVLGSNK